MVEAAPVDLGIAGLGPAVRIGSGGFADVYRARQSNLNREVAVKVLRAAAGDEQARMRFERECHALGAVSGHPNIVGVHEGGFTADGRAYLVMEFCPGGSLSDHLARSGPMSAAEVIDIGVKIGRALGVAHSAGVVHRDVKPGNILVTAFGEPALADFGIARVEGGDQTATGTVTASLAHAAPEVLEGATPSPASDLYSLGSTLWELFTGNPPHYRPADESVWALMRRVLTEPMPDPASRGMPEPLASTVWKATARHAASRFPRAEELVAALSAPAGAPIPAQPPTVVAAPGTTFAGAPTVPEAATNPPSAGYQSVGYPASAGYPAAATNPPPAGYPAAALHRSGPDVTFEPTVAARGGSTWDMPAGPGPAPAGSAGGRSSSTPWLVGALALVLVAALVGGALVLLRPDRATDTGGPTASGGTEDTTADTSGVVPVAEDTVVLEIPQAVVGPLDRSQAYTVSVAGGGDGATYQLLVNGAPVGEPVPSLTQFVPDVAGRLSLTATATTAEGETFTSDPVEAYVIGPVPAAGWRANLSSNPADADKWPATLAQFDQLVAAGHTELQLLPSDRFATLTPGYWNLFVPGFADAEAGKAYCENYGLAVPTECFASRFDPGGA